MNGLRKFALAGIVALAVVAAGPALAQSANALVGWQCKTTQPVGWCPTSATSPMPVTLVSGSTPGDTNIAQWGGAVTTLGQKAMASSVPVTIASNQSGLPGTGTVGAAVPTVATVIALRDSSGNTFIPQTDGTGILQVGVVGGSVGLLPGSARIGSVDLGPYSFGRVTADGQIKASSGFVHTITISPTGSVTAGVLTLYDNTTEAGTVIASFSLPVTTFTPFSVSFDATAATGLFVGFDGTLANVQATVTYR